MNSNLLGLVKAAADDGFNKGFSIGGSILPVLLGTLGGGAAGYLTGDDEDETNGQKSTRWRNALIGALLGNVTTGVGYYGLLNGLANAVDKIPETETQLDFFNGKLIGEKKVPVGTMKKFTEDFESGKLGLGGSDNNGSENSNMNKQGSSFIPGLGVGTAVSALNAANMNVAIPALLGLLGGGAAGYALTDDKKNKLKNAILGALTGTTAGALGGGALDIMATTGEYNNLASSLSSLSSPSSSAS